MAKPEEKALRQISVFTNRGFTLLEVLVVLVIIGLLAGVASLSLAGFSQSPAQQISHLFYQQLQQARQAAVFSNRDLGIQLNTEHYSFWQLHQGQWQPLLKKRLSQTPWPESVAPKLQVEQQPVNLQRAQTPQILIYTDGQILPFQLQLNSHSQQWQISAGFDQQLQIKSGSTDQ